MITKMKIINIRKKNKRTTNCIISLLDTNNNSIELELSMDLVVSEQLGNDKEISKELLNKLIEKQRIIDAKQTAFNYVSFRKRSTKQVIDKLKQNNFTDNEINITIECLANNGLLNDKIFAKTLIKDILLTKKVGRNKIFNLLYEKGINKDIISTTLAEYFPNDTLETAIIVAERKYNLIKNKSPEKIKPSLFNHLVSKGFSSDEAKKAMDIVFNKYF